MKRFLIILLCVVSAGAMFAQGTFEQFKQRQQAQFNQSKSERQTEYDEFVARQNEEFAAFLAEKWQLFEERKMEQLALFAPKPKTVPIAPNTQVEAPVVNFEETVQNVVHATASVGAGAGYEVRTSVNAAGTTAVGAPTRTPSKGTVATSTITFQFYNQTLTLPFGDKLRLRSAGVAESQVADYFRTISRFADETHALWTAIDKQVAAFGLNEWGYFCVLRSLAEVAFTNIDDRVLFCFYMLRNEGHFKAKLARGRDSGKLTLLLALDNKKEVYSYVFFRFPEENKTSVKYYAVYGGGSAKESVFSYAFNEQDANLRQMRLDFGHSLAIGKCDKHRTLKIQKMGTQVVVPYNSANLAYLNDVPMTVFPIYFLSPLAPEAKEALTAKFGLLKTTYSPQQAVEILLNFVQTAFCYKTDEEQFGYEKYFYPEEVVGYPYSDCEDRAALFSWLVKTYTDAQVIGLQYDGHIATAVCFGADVQQSGDSFAYGGKKYYVCDPTYINATIGMSMPQYKGVVPKVVKLKL